ncbi:hypothetical protein P4O66_015484 [Electrophorus voltai]|uniref:Apoptotic protease-activating factor 1 n=1 Tax=Electrophorus voltai TaxID=2609070 RepID=A0AAD8Z0Z3_9TELE|nr:hypothetical protein P4O66_015484 [Electrophorus voltai]
MKVIYCDKILKAPRYFGDSNHLSWGMQRGIEAIKSICVMCRNHGVRVEMEERALSCLLRSRPTMEQDIKASYLMDHMVSDGVLTQDEEDGVLSKATRKEQAAALLDLLLRKDNRAYVSFYNALIREGYGDLASLLYTDLPQLSPEGGKSYWTGISPTVPPVALYPLMFARALFLGIFACNTVCEVGALIPVQVKLSEGGVPQRPTVFVNRPTLLTQVREKLKRLQNAVGWVTVFGMAGSGKSVLAAEAVRDHALITECFPDGVHWLSVGQCERAELLVRMQSLCFRLEQGQSLEASLRPPGSVEEARERLRFLMLRRFPRCLLILDDIWDINSLRAFDIQCRVLLTTRHRDLTDSVSGLRYSVPVESGLDEEKALEILSLYVNAKPQNLPEQARRIVEECKGSPLVVSLIGALLRDFPDRWGYYLRQLQKKQFQRIRKSSSYDYEALDQAMDASLQVLDDEHRELYKDLSVLEKDVKVPAKVLSVLWSLELEEVEDVLQEFVNKSLLFRDCNRRPYLYYLHDLQLDFLTEQNRAQLPVSATPAHPSRLIIRKKLHGKVVCQYQRAYTEGPPTSGDEEDLYWYRFLPCHMARAGLSKELCSLMFSLDWVKNKAQLMGSAHLINDYVEYSAILDRENSEVRLQFQEFLSLNGPQLEQKPLPDVVQLALSQPCCSEVYRQALLQAQRSASRGQLSPRLGVCHRRLICLGGVLEQGNGPIVRDSPRASCFFFRFLETNHNFHGCLRFALLPLLALLRPQEQEQSGEPVTAGGPSSAELGLPHLLLQRREQDRLLWGQQHTAGGKPHCFLFVTCSVLSRVSPDCLRYKMEADPHQVFKSTSGERLQEIQAHDDEILCCAFSPDDRHIATCSSDRKIKIWNVERGTLIRMFKEEYEEQVNHCQFTNHQRRILLATCSNDKIVNTKLWNMNKPTSQNTLFGHMEPVNHCCFSPDDAYLATSSNDGSVKLFEVASANEWKTIQVAQYFPESDEETSITVKCSTWSADGARIICAARNTAFVFDVATLGMLLEIRTSRLSTVQYCQACPTSQLLALALSHYTVELWDFGVNKKMAECSGHLSWVHCVQFSPNGSLLLSCSDDQTIRLWETERVHTSSAVALKRDFDVLFHQGDVTVVAADSKNRLEVRSGAASTLVFESEEQKSRIRSTCICGQGPTVALGTDDGTVQVARMSSRQVQRSIGWKVMPLLNPQRVLAQVLGLMLGPAQVLETPSGNILATLHGHTKTVHHCLFTDNGQTLITSSEDATLRVWKWMTGECRVLEGHQEPVRKFHLLGGSSSSPMLLSWSFDGTVKVWDLSSGEKLHDLKCHEAAILSGDVTPGEHLFSTGSADNSAKVWSCTSWKMEFCLSGHKACVRSCRFSWDDRRLATGDDNGEIRLWSMLDGALLKTCAQNTKDCMDSFHGGWVTDLHFSPDNKVLVSTGGYIKDSTLTACFSVPRLQWWSVQRGEALQTFRTTGANLKRIHASPDFKTFVTIDNMGILYILKQVEGRL